MDKNVGGIDRIGRIIIGAIVVITGIAALTGYWAAGAVIGGVALVVGAILLVTGTTQKCPINEAVGIDTTEKGKWVRFSVNSEDGE
ncbi:YgaP-like transmembrane domain [Salinigranum marinum]|uniref:YgaP-like transmembrane domain n=1 Tax=Salinigranum marinum TaxID=1515595 RepID=UPI002989F0BA|nr:YgaP-like transmembrane domain [Salinigranum marinum]